MFSALFIAKNVRHSVGRVPEDVSQVQGQELH